VLPLWSGGSRDGWQRRVDVAGKARRRRGGGAGGLRAGLGAVVARGKSGDALGAVEGDGAAGGGEGEAAQFVGACDVADGEAGGWGKLGGGGGGWGPRGWAGSSPSLAWRLGGAKTAGGGALGEGSGRMMETMRPASSWWTMARARTGWWPQG